MVWMVRLEVSYALWLSIKDKDKDQDIKWPRRTQ